ncbi:MAG: hypothetical protein LBP55_09530 [Candidatus Adiutrix sp.]|jgi:hypothetical protein|nr:hypothetical protein [Candidatus Adiutrix sp.]
MTRKNDNLMEKLVEELNLQVPFKDTTEIGDTVIMLRENEDGMVTMLYAQVIDFERDTAKRDEWWHVRFVFLEVPPQPRTIILQTPHFTGREIFTMGGRKVFIKAVNFEAFEEQLDMIDEPTVVPKGRKKKDPAAPKPGKPEPKPTFTLIK